MSEFAESWHLAADDGGAGAALLERAGLAGWVFPASGGWVTVVPDAPFAQPPVDELVAVNDGVLVHYTNAEDHGWSLAAWAGRIPVGRYEIEWTFDEPTATGDLDPEQFAEVVEGAVPGLTVDRVELARLLDAGHVTSLLDSLQNPAPRVAALLGWADYDWISGPYLAADPPARAVRIG